MTGAGAGAASGHDAARRSYDAVARQYARQFGDELTRKPLDRALLALLIEEVGEGATVADLGCGPGHVAAWLAERGARVVGIDLSQAMVDTGKEEFPVVEFRQGDLLALPAHDEEFDAAVSLYAVIHLRAGELGGALAEMRRVLRPAAPLLVSFHVGTEVRHRDELLGQAVDLDFRFFEMEEVAEAMEGAGFTVAARLQRAPYPGEVETTRGYVLGR
jgi:ubiquinone/menaquinone biosynthesis C-methylase UbiE